MLGREVGAKEVRSWADGPCRPRGFHGVVLCGVTEDSATNPMKMGGGEDQLPQAHHPHCGFCSRRCHDRTSPWKLPRPATAISTPQ